MSGEPGGLDIAPCPSGCGTFTQPTFESNEYYDDLLWCDTCKCSFASCAKCGYDKFIHGGMKDMPYMKYGMYKCPKCGHDVQVAIDPSKASPCAIGTGGFPRF